MAGNNATTSTPCPLMIGASADWTKLSEPIKDQRGFHLHKNREDQNGLEMEKVSLPYNQRPPNEG